MRVRDTLSSESEHLKARVCAGAGPLWGDLAVRRRRSRDCEDEEQCGLDHGYAAYEMPDQSVLSYLMFIPRAISHSLRNMARGKRAAFIYVLFRTNLLALLCCCFLL